MIKAFRSSLLVRIVVSQLVLGIFPLLFLGVASMVRTNSVLKNAAINFQNESVRQGAMYINLVMDDVGELDRQPLGN
jgi:hypothetical protein